MGNVVVEDTAVYWERVARKLLRDNEELTDLLAKSMELNKRYEIQWNELCAAARINVYTQGRADAAAALAAASGTPERG